MVNPVIAFFGATELVNALMNIGTDLYSKPAEFKALNYTLDYERGAYNENQRYWNEYYKNTGKKARYPYRSGGNYNLSQFYNTQYYKAQSTAQFGRNVGSALYGAGLYKYGGRRK